MTPTQVSKSNWLDPLNKIIWQKAFRERATEMTLRDGRVFTIRYKTMCPFGDSEARRKGVVVDYAWVQPKGTLGPPCGWFQVKDVLNPDWRLTADA